MIIDGFNLKSIAVSKLERNSPRSVDSHCPLIAARTFEFVKMHALQRAKILQPLRSIHGKQQIDRGFCIQPAERICPAFLPKFPSGRIRP